MRTILRGGFDFVFVHNDQLQCSAASSISHVGLGLALLQQALDDTCVAFAGCYVECSLASCFIHSIHITGFLERARQERILLSGAVIYLVNSGGGGRMYNP